MNTKFEASFEKDVKKVRERTMLQTIKESILDVKQSKTIRDIANLKKLKGYETCYRIRCGRYRIGIEIIDDTVIFTRSLHRKDIYRYFPKG